MRSLFILFCVFALVMANNTPAPWKCIQSCQDKNNFVWARDYGDGRIQCAGPAGNTACYWFMEPTCGLATGGQVPNNSPGTWGLFCTGYNSNWCAEAKKQFWLHQPQSVCTPCNGWTCLQSCQDNKQFVAVKSFTLPKIRTNTKAVIGCQGFNSMSGACIWSSSQAACASSSCTYSNVTGTLCTGYSGYWCKTASDVLWNKKVAPVCQSL